MDYLNPTKRRNHLIRLFSGYLLAAIGVTAAVVVLFYLVLGFSYKNGVVIQNGMLYISSSPPGAQVTLNGTPNGTTNNRVITPAGKYQIDLSRTGYRSWQRTVILRGGRVQHYDYPLLFPNQLVSSSIANIDGNVSLATESPDNNWLLLNDPSSSHKFDLINLSTPGSPLVSSFTLPDKLASTGTGESWQVVEWADDSSHVLLKHGFDGKFEYIVVDITSPSKSVNLNTEFGTVPATVELFNESYNQYWFYDSANGELSQASLSDKKVTPFLSNVLAFKGYGDSIVLYATKTKSDHAKVVWHQNDNNYVLANNLPLDKPAGDYLLDLAQFRGDWYAVVGETSGDGVSIYKNPLTFIGNHPNQLPRVNFTMKILHPGYEKFSANAQFVLVESGRSISIFNTLYHTSYNYEVNKLDAPQQHVVWMDGFHLLHVANGQLVLSDFNNINQQTLVAASSSYPPFFSNNFEYLYTLQTNTESGKVVTSVSSTPLRLPADI